MANQSIYDSRVSAIKEEDYYTILGIRQKHMTLILVTLFVNLGIIIPFYGNPINLAFTDPILFTVLMIPTFFVILLVKGVIASPLYSFLNSFFKITPTFNTKYLTNDRKNITGYIINSLNERVVVFKLDSDDFYDKTNDEKLSIFSMFNQFLINTEQNVIFRVINKPLNLNTYFDIIESQVNKDNIVYETYFSNLAEEYIRISRNIPDYDYYLEVHFPPNTSDSEIETQLKVIVNNMAKYLNISTAPKLLRQSDLITYVRKIITSGSEYTSNFSIPIVTDY